MRVLGQLDHRDLQAVLDFAGSTGGLEPDDAYAPELLRGLRELIPADAVTYQEFEVDARRDRLLVGLDGEEPYRWEPSPTEPVDPDSALYWSVGPCPIVHHRVRENDLQALRMSDVVSSRRFRELPVYREYFRRWGIRHALDLGLPGRPPRRRSLILFRTEGGRDFSERDRAVLEALRPHFWHLERVAELRRQLREALEGAKRTPGDTDGGGHDPLTPREREIVELVAEGQTNAEIAAHLWIAPSTVKKHLENVYAKVGVGRRSAAAVLVRAGR